MNDAYRYSSIWYNLYTQSSALPGDILLEYKETIIKSIRSAIDESESIDYQNGLLRALEIIREATR